MWNLIRFDGGGWLNISISLVKIIDIFERQDDLSFEQDHLTKFTAD